MRMKSETIKLLMGAGMGLLLSTPLACADEQTASGQICIAGQQIACDCPGGVSGVQVCNVLGTFDACMCGDEPMPDTDGYDTDGEGDSSDTKADTGESTTGDDGPVCGNGTVEPGECDPEGTNYCAIDCDDEPATTGDDSDGGSTGEVDACASEPIYVDMVANVPSVWELNGIQGFGAGRMMCQNLGADDVCSYDQIVAAEAAGEFATVPQGTTAWLHRTSSALYMGQMVAADPRSRCADWTYSTNHINDGEYVEFGAAGALTYNLDTDPASFPQGVMDCGGVSRAILCCNVCEQ